MLPIEGAEFSVKDVLLKATSENQHSVHLCAHNRVVRTESLKGQLPHLDAPLPTADGQQVVYSGYITGSFLDERVDALRTSFILDEEDELRFQGGLTWEGLVSGVFQAVSEYLEPRTLELRTQAMDRVRRYVETKAPRYRPLLTHRAELIERLQSNLPDATLEIELHKLHVDWKHEVHQEIQKQLSDVDEAPSDFEQHRKDFRRALGDLQEVAKSELAEYVIQRATVLSFFDKLLGKQKSGRFALEDAIHSIFFPQRHTSDEIDYDDHNLWMIDERLAYHQFLASDKPFNQHSGPVYVDSLDRPDLLIYNNPIAFTPGEPPFPSVVIVEFKRPERDDYSDNENPIRQVLGYVEQIQNGKATRPNGATIEQPPQMMPFYCYVVATLTPKLKTEALNRGFTQAPDGSGFFWYNPNLKSYFEVFSYEKVLGDAKKRNRALFEKLGISKI